ncbi:MAG: hypothetical protein A3A98_01105 [Candidatus Staskawiczbacteria bacterium RIFCSPLOWO2_01_FULL_40_39]|uniref:Serine hydrolase FSH domain-containing protein n=1 Tax=Candidatus Staskawiczbacteria bacterium RIFCSPHIGHO2_01_FULL_39_25 TaxID=1802202 RepID=A0A1G2HNA0_9BACT|nr:MAG: hypothetical protein A2730_01105 [Candidatus Staskawiczbacteria bacterium RIFCSPHIGHO2_01_FULL_39_25]OGZ73327.1 MAG: hypothetical protein A3A98_01105 [Candidatus Staskawiczbacteria bacterium RIFCSPLOWO2_01_FULL_40_39]OGZ75445.1 MAG: hypothetical protein A3I87_01600 [Candidatus Staskawiczbacteria bacterium RIFCSPLOWO2_02_FULL_39_8]
MKKQIVIIHGGTTFDNYEEYINFLKNSKVNAEKFKTSKHWQNFLDKELEEIFEVFTPRMPNRNNARYQEWRIWFEKIIPFINDDVILLGYSLGGIFLAKYLSENIFPKKIKAVLLVATPFNSVGLKESLGDFTLSTPLKDFSLQTKKTYLIFSKDDSDVPFEQLDKYKKILSNSEIMNFIDKGHFYQDSFPEIVELIKNI